MEPLLLFLPQPEIVLTESEEKVETPVKEKMGELAAALEQPEEEMRDSLEKVSLDD